jgi:hypothetical protein
MDPIQHQAVTRHRGQSRDLYRVLCPLPAILEGDGCMNAILLRRRDTFHWLPFHILLLVLFVLSAPQARAEKNQAGGVLINEFMASNGSTIADEDGDWSDWLELYNGGGEAVSLEGYGLSDDVSRPFRWTLPAVTLEPGHYLLIWASGKNRVDPASPLHTNFSISASGEPLLLTHPLHGLVDQVEPLALRRDISSGRQPDGSETWRYFAEPTPGAPNDSTGYTTFLDPPQFSHQGGFYIAPFELALSSPDPAVTILYTLDGSLPDPANLDGRTYTYKQQYPFAPGDPLGDLLEASFHSQAYSAPIAVGDRSAEPDRLTGRATTYHRAPFYAPVEPVFKGTVVRARAFKEGALPSDAATHSYYVTPVGAGRYDIPVLSLAIQEDYLFDYDTGTYVAGVDFDEWRRSRPNAETTMSRPANYGRRGDAWEYPLHLELFEPEGGRAFGQNLGYRIHGNMSRAYPQKSLRLYASSAYDDRSTLDYAFFPGLTDEVRGQPITSFQRLLLRNGGNDNEHTRIRDAFIQTLLQPFALDHQAYSPAVHFINGEYWGLIDIRERIDRYYVASHHGVDPDDVALLEDDAVLEEGTEADREDWLALRDYIAEHDMADPAHLAYVADRLDLDNFVRYHVAQIYINNTDWPGNNLTYWRKHTPDRSPGSPATHDGRWRYILYDLDFGWGPGGVYNYWDDTLTFATMPGGPAWPNPDWSTVMLRKLLENPDIRARFINLMADHMNTTFQPQHAESLLDQMHGRIAPYLPEHVQRWRNTQDTEPHFMREFAWERPAWMRQHMINYFGLAGTADLVIDTPDAQRGTIRVNTITIGPDTPGVTDPSLPYPWRGEYYVGVPVEVEALPAEGYRFAGWSGLPEGTPARATITLPAAGESLALVAHFEPEPLSPSELLHYLPVVSGGTDEEEAAAR